MKALELTQYTIKRRLAALLSCAGHYRQNPKIVVYKKVSWLRECLARPEGLSA